MGSWDHTTDILVVGSGGGGLTAALMARDLKNDALVIEKSAYYGGSTAMSGGAIWAPNNHLMGHHGYQDSPDEALTYLKVLTKGKVAEERLRSYVDVIPEMVRYLEEHSHVSFQVVPDYPDYYAHIEGSKPGGGRTIEPRTVSIRRLPKEMRPQLRLPGAQGVVFGKMMVNAYEGRVLMDASLGARLRVAGMFASFYLNPFRCLANADTRLTLGNALIARLRLSLAERDTPVWLNTAANKLICEQGRVTGLEAERDGKTVRIRARKGVILAAGGFEKNDSMRKKYQRQPVSAEWSVGCPENTGDAIQMGLEIGSALGLMDDAWWMPTTMVPAECLPWVTKNSWWEPITKIAGAHLPWFNIIDRALPGSIFVNVAGKRYTNEAAPYIDVVREQYEIHSEETQAIPAFMIVDQRYHNRYPNGPIMPRFSTSKHVEKGFIAKADTLEELAEACGIDPQGLVAEVNKLNEYSATGEDQDFARGHSPIDRYYADPNVKPNPCLAPLDKPPYYAMKVYPGDLGTKGGLETDAHARVLREDGIPIAGLYATGNCSASVMGDTYPGAGGTIGPSMTFGYIAARHAAEE